MDICMPDECTAFLIDIHRTGYNMRLKRLMQGMPAVSLLLLGLLVLTGCERRPLEELAYQHAKVQARLNAANFERSQEIRKRQQLSLRKQFNNDDDDDDD